MGLRAELRAFISAISETGDATKNLQAFERIVAKHTAKKGHCMFCGQQYDAEIKGLLFARERVVEPYDVPADFKIDQRLRELNWDVDEKGTEYK
jgi:hypothetical protein